MSGSPWAEVWPGLTGFGYTRASERSGDVPCAQLGFSALGHRRARGSVPRSSCFRSFRSFRGAWRRLRVLRGPAGGANESLGAANGANGRRRGVGREERRGERRGTAESAASPAKPRTSLRQCLRSPRECAGLRLVRDEHFESLSIDRYWRAVCSDDQKSSQDKIKRLKQEAKAQLDPDCIFSRSHVFVANLCKLQSQTSEKTPCITCITAWQAGRHFRSHILHRVVSPYSPLLGAQDQDRPLGCGFPACQWWNRTSGSVDRAASWKSGDTGRASLDAKEYGGNHWSTIWFCHKILWNQENFLRMKAIHIFYECWERWLSRLLEKNISIAVA